MDSVIEHDGYKESSIVLDCDDFGCDLYCSDCNTMMAVYYSGRITGFMRSEHVLEAAQLIKTHKCSANVDEE